MYGYIYKTTNLIDNKIYIGQHKANNLPLKINYYGSGTYLQRAIKKYGKKNFKVEIINICDSIEELDNMEIIFIKYYTNLLGKDRLYNIQTGGRQGSKWELTTEEDRKRHSEAIKKSKQTEKYKQWYKDTKQIRSKQQSKRMLGHKMDNNTKNALYIASKNSKRTEQQKQKMKDVWHKTHTNMDFKTNSGRKCMYKNNIIKYIKEKEIDNYIKEGWKFGNPKNRNRNGYKHSEETKNKIGLKHRGKAISQEQRLKISNTLKNRNKKL